MVAEAELLCQQSSISDLDVQYLCVPKAAAPSPIEHHLLEVSASPPKQKQPSIFREFQASELVSIDFSNSGSVLSCKSNIQTTVMEPSSSEFLPRICSGSHTDIGCRASNEDEHIRIDDLSAYRGYLFGCRLPSAFYAVFDGHGGSNAAAYLKENAMKVFFEDMDWPQTSDIDEAFLEKLQDCHCKAFLLADQALADNCIIPAFCGTTALTALVVGRSLMVANAGDCRAVLCRKGVAVQMSQDHRPSSSPERKRVEELGGFIEYGYLNGELSVTRALGDWYLKSPLGSASPLTAEPEVQQIILRDDDEFLIIACDGIWDVMSNQNAVSLVRYKLRHHCDPQQCAQELVKEALRINATDNLTAIVICFTSPARHASIPPQRPRFRCCSLSEEARNK